MHSAKKKKLLKDYTPYPFDITSAQLTFRLHPKKCRVLTRLNVKPSSSETAEMFLNGENLKLIACSVDGASIAYRRIPGKHPGVIFMTGFRSDMTGDKALALEDFCREPNVNSTNI